MSSTKNRPDQPQRKTPASVAGERPEKAATGRDMKPANSPGKGEQRNPSKRS